MRAYGVRGAHWEAKIIFFKIKWFLGMTRCHACCVTPPCIQKSALAAICTSVGSWRPNHLFAGTLWISPEIQSGMLFQKGSIRRHGMAGEAL